MSGHAQGREPISSAQVDEAIYVCGLSQLNFLNHDFPSDEGGQDKKTAALEALAKRCVARHYTPIDRALVKSAAVALLKRIEVQNAQELVDAVFDAVVAASRPRKAEPAAPNGGNGRYNGGASKATNDNSVPPTGTNGAGPAVVPEAWPEPAPLPELPSVPQWNDALLPEVLRAWVADAAERMQAPIEFVAATAIVVASSLIGTVIAMRPRALDNWSVIANLWAILIGAPGTKKSPSKDEACRPFASIIEADKSAALADLGSRMFDASVAEAEMSALKDQLKSLTKSKKHDEVQKLKDRFVELQGQLNGGQGERRYVTSQCTPEALIKLLNENPRGLLLSRDELSGWFAALDRPDHAADRKFFLECWNGYGTYDHDTKSSGHIHCESTCLSIIGCMTPGSLAGYMRAAMRGGSGADGLVQRFQLAVFPDRRIRKRVDKRPDQDAYKLALQAFTRLAALQPGDVGAQVLDDNKPPFLRFDSAAQVEWDAWEDALNARIDQGEYPEAFESHLSKYPSLAASLALIFHLLDQPMGGPVTLDALGRALAWAQLLEAHATRIYAAATVGDDGTVRTLWKRITSGRLGASFTVRALKKLDWSGLTTEEAVENALRQLADHGWIRLVDEHSPSGGRPSRKVLVHPAVVAKWGSDD